MPVGRPQLDEHRRKVTVGVRVLPSVRDHLADKYGSAGQGLAHIVEEWARHPDRAETDPRRLKSVDLNDLADGKVLVTAEEQAGSAGPHRHKRGALTAKTYVMGVEQRHYECAIEGCQITLHD